MTHPDPNAAQLAYLQGATAQFEQHAAQGTSVPIARLMLYVHDRLGLDVLRALPNMPHETPLRMFTLTVVTAAFQRYTKGLNAIGIRSALAYAVDEQNYFVNTWRDDIKIRSDFETLLRDLIFQDYEDLSSGLRPEWHAVLVSPNDADFGQHQEMEGYFAAVHAFYAQRVLDQIERSPESIDARVDLLDLSFKGEAPTDEQMAELARKYPSLGFRVASYTATSSRLDEQRSQFEGRPFTPALNATRDPIEGLIDFVDDLKASDDPRAQVRAQAVLSLIRRLMKAEPRVNALYVRALAVALYVHALNAVYAQIPKGEGEYTELVFQTPEGTSDVRLVENAPDLAERVQRGELRPYEGLSVIGHVLALAFAGDALRPEIRALLTEPAQLNLPPDHTDDQAAEALTERFMAALRALPPRTTHA